MNSVEQEEVDEARKLAEEWELKYKEMQRQMTDLDMVRRMNMDKKVQETNLIACIVRQISTIQMYFKALDGLLVGTAANAVHALGGLRGLAAATPL